MEQILIDTEYIKLDQLLKLANIVSSGAEAHIFIKESKVKLNGEIELQKRKKIKNKDIVEVLDKKIQVVFNAGK